MNPKKIQVEVQKVQMQNIQKLKNNLPAHSCTPVILVGSSILVMGIM